MATAEQIKSLIRSHLSKDPERFYTAALQVAAHEAHKGHGALAHEIRAIIDKSRKDQGATIIKFPQDLKNLVVSEQPDATMSSIVLPPDLKKRLNRVTLEYRQQHKLKQYGLSHRRKILLIGPPGTGKTMSARVLANELRLPLHTVQVDKMVTRFMGETGAKLRQVFDLIEQETAVFLFDEFDAIGGERMLDNDVGEMRRVLNAFLQFIEQSSSDSLIVAATNSPKLLDRALFRRFDDVLYYERPNSNDRKQLMQNILAQFITKQFSWDAIVKISDGLSHAEIDHACRDAIKETILTDQKTLKPILLQQMLQERQDSHRK